MADKKIQGSLEITGKLNPNSSGYGFNIPDTTDWTVDKNIATTNDTIEIIDWDGERVFTQEEVIKLSNFKAVISINIDGTIPRGFYIPTHQNGNKIVLSSNYLYDDGIGNISFASIIINKSTRIGRGYSGAFEDALPSIIHWDGERVFTEDEIYAIKHKAGTMVEYDDQFLRLSNDDTADGIIYLVNLNLQTSNNGGLPESQLQGIAIDLYTNEGTYYYYNLKDLFKIIEWDGIRDFTEEEIDILVNNPGSVVRRDMSTDSNPILATYIVSQVSNDYIYLTCFIPENGAYLPDSFVGLLSISRIFNHLGEVEVFDYTLEEAARNCYKKNSSLIPTTTNTNDLGSSSYKFKDAYFGGKITFGSYLNATSDFDLYVAGTHKIRLGTTTFRPAVNNSLDLGTSSYAWKDAYFSGDIHLPNYVVKEKSTFYAITDNNNANLLLLNSTSLNVRNVYPLSNNGWDIGSSGVQWRDIYLAGNLSDGTNSFTVAHAYNLLENVVDDTSGDLSADKILEESISADKTYNVPAHAIGVEPECRAIITNSGNATITLSFVNVRRCLCNDDDAVISSTENALTHIWTTTITLSAGASYEISIMHNDMCAVNFSAN